MLVLHAIHMHLLQFRGLDWLYHSAPLLWMQYYHLLLLVTYRGCVMDHVVPLISLFRSCKHRHQWHRMSPSSRGHTVYPPRLGEVKLRRTFCIASLLWGHPLGRTHPLLLNAWYPHRPFRQGRTYPKYHVHHHQNQWGSNDQTRQNLPLLL